MMLIIPRTIFMVLSSKQSHCKSSSSCNLSDEHKSAPCGCRVPTVKAHQPTWAVSLPVGCYRLHPPSPLVVIALPKHFCHFIEGREMISVLKCVHM